MHVNALFVFLQIEVVRIFKLVLSVVCSSALSAEMNDKIIQIIL